MSAAAGSKHATSGGLAIHYQDSGAGPPLELLAGWTASGLLWPAAFVAPLERGARLLRVCNRGTGRSGPVAGAFTIADMAADALAVLDAEGVGRADVVGWSMGGLIAQELATRHPERVARLVLVASPVPRPVLVDVPPEVQLRLFAPPLPGTPIREVIRGLWAGLVADGTAGRHAATLDRLVDDILLAPTPVEVIALQWQAIIAALDDAPHGVERLAGVAAPTLVVQGAEDPLVPAGNGRALARLVPGARYEELPGVGHLVAWEAPERLAALVRGFLAATPGAAGGAAGGRGGDGAGGG